MDIIIRNEGQSDIETISVITKAAFEKLPISNHTEQSIINALRNANALTISLVAEKEKKVVGHIALSPVTVSDGSLD
jgi:putative acetyltransferase